MTTMTDDETKTDDVPAGCWVDQDIDGWWRWGVLCAGAKVVEDGYDTEADAIAACREHARRIVEGSELVAELRQKLLRVGNLLQLIWSAGKRTAKENEQLRAEVKRVTGQRDFAVRQAEKFQAERDALRSEVEAACELTASYLEERNTLRAQLKARDAELARLREHGCLGRARTWTPERPCWAIVETEARASRVYAEWCGICWWAEETQLNEVVTRYWPIPEPTEVDDGE